MSAMLEKRESDSQTISQYKKEYINITAPGFTFKVVRICDDHAHPN